MARADHQASRVDYLLQRLCDERLEKSEAVELSELLAEQRVGAATLRGSWCNCAQRWPIGRNRQVAVRCLWRFHSKPWRRWEWARQRAFNIDSMKRCSAGTNGGGTRQTGRRRRSGRSQRSRGVAIPFGCWRRWRRCCCCRRAFWPGSNLGGDDAKNSAVAVKENARRRRNERIAGSGRMCIRVRIVARVVEVTADAEWDDADQPREFLMRLRPGDRLHLRSGLAQLEFYSGRSDHFAGSEQVCAHGTGGRHARVWPADRQSG